MARLSTSTILVGHYRYVEERGEYVGAVASQDAATKTMTVLTIGAEASEMAILDWIKRTIEMMRAAGQTNVQAPDMYDRLRSAPDLNS